MAKYISKEELMEQYPEFDGYTFADVTAIDIVHCDECIHAFAQPEGDKKNANKIFCVILSIFVDRDFFCAEGKRKEE